MASVISFNGRLHFNVGHNLCKAGLTGQPIKACYVLFAAAQWAGISMGFAEALSDDGIVTGCGIVWGAITAGATGLHGMLQTLPFLISNLQSALHLA